MKAFATLFFSLGIQLCLAQPEFDFEKIKTRHPGEDAYMLNYSETLEISLHGDKLKISKDFSSDLLLLSDKASMYSHKSFAYTSAFETIRDLEARSYIPDGKGFKKIKVDRFETRNRSSASVFYDDVIEKSFSFPALRKGAVASLHYTNTINDPHFLGAFYFPTNFSGENASFTLKFPSSVKIKYLIWGDTTGVRLQKTEKKKESTYIWSCSSVKKINAEENSPDYSYYGPHIIVFIDSYQYDDKTIPVLSDISQLYKWYYSLVKEPCSQQSVTLSAFVDSITKNIKKPIDRAEKLYYWVQESISYIAFENGMGGFIPRMPADVYSKKYGDCKDMATLLYSMLKKAGLDAHIAWIGTRDIPYTYKDLPSPFVDNHMIVALKMDGQWMFLDPTVKFLPISTPPYHIMGKEALISLDADKFEIAKVPVANPDFSSRTDTMKLKIDGSRLLAEGSTSYQGFQKHFLDFHLLYSSGKDRQTELSRYFRRCGNKSVVDSLSYTGLFNRTAPLFCKYKISIPDQIRETEGAIFVNLNLTKPLENDKLEKDRQMPREFNYAYQDEELTKFEIPKGYKVSYLPEKYEVDDKNVHVKLEYKLNKGEIILYRTFMLKTLMLERPDFKAWNEMISGLNGAYKEAIRLEKI